jgi:hypothetical protein
LTTNSPGSLRTSVCLFFHKVVDNKEIGNKIFYLRWWLWDFSGMSHELLLADNPLIFTGALDAPELIVALPISPTKAFLATRGDRTATRLRSLNPKTLAVRLNESSVLQARARVYARSVAPIRFIANRIRPHP